MPEAYSRNESLLGRVFDQYQNLMQVASCIRVTAEMRGCGRPRVLELSRRETGLAEYLPDADITRHPTHDKERPAFDEAQMSRFGDRSFDACLVTDAYEHLPRELRPALLRQMIRVTDGVVLLGCPTDAGMVSRLDRLVFDFIWGKYADQYKPLLQHVEYGLDTLESIMETLRSEGADKVVALPCNYVYRWIHQILIYFDLQHKHPASSIYEPINRIYNERLSPYDYREPCYRYLIVVATDPSLDLEVLNDKLKSPPKPPPSVAEAEGVLVEAFRAAEGRAGSQLRETTMEIQRLQRQIEHLTSVVNRLSVHRWRRWLSTLRGLWLR
jgi:hypothetical protein